MTIVRLWFTKTGDAAYISLLDLQRVMQRAFHAAKVPAWYTQGFNPHIYMSFNAPLSIMQESVVESLDFKTELSNFPFEDIKEKMNAVLPLGIRVVKLEPAVMEPQVIEFAEYQITYDEQNSASAKKAFEKYNVLSEAIVQKKTKSGIKDVDLKKVVTIIGSKIVDGKFVINIEFPAGQALNINPALLLDFIEEKFSLRNVQGNILRIKLMTKNRENFK